MSQHLQSLAAVVAKQSMATLPQGLAAVRAGPATDLPLGHRCLRAGLVCFPIDEGSQVVLSLVTSVGYRHKQPQQSAPPGVGDAHLERLELLKALSEEQNELSCLAV